MRTALLLALVLAFTPPAGAQCCGDCSGDGTVTINDLIASVLNSLDGCGTPADRCATDLHDDNSRGPFCHFDGLYNVPERACRYATIGASLSSTGAVFIVVLDTEPLAMLGGEVITSNVGNLLAWSTDGFNTSEPLGGTIAIEDNGAILSVRPVEPPFSIDGCDFVGYVGRYDGTPGAGSALRISQSMRDALSALAHRPTPPRKPLENFTRAAPRS